jgi:hypothetical protein
MIEFKDVYFTNLIRRLMPGLPSTRYIKQELANLDKKESKLKQAYQQSQQRQVTICIFVSLLTGLSWRQFAIYILPAKKPTSMLPAVIAGFFSTLGVSYFFPSANKNKLQEVYEQRAELNAQLDLIFKKRKEWQHSSR